MNYRHVFHAGNHTELFKHSVLVYLILHLRRKERPFMVLDTHAGVGLYDLESDEAIRTGEAAGGIKKVFDVSPPTAGPYFEIVRSLNHPGELRYYPGSPTLICQLLRQDDHLIACELHEDDVNDLRARFREDARVSVHARDGYEAMLALIPPAERRGLIFVDPPFEAKDEFRTLASKLTAAYRKWPTGIFAAWYPIKDRSLVRPFIESMRAAYISKCLSVELLPYPVDDVRLAGSGMIILNPPWQMEIWLNAICKELLEALNAADGSWSLGWLK